MISKKSILPPIFSLIFLLVVDLVLFKGVSSFFHNILEKRYFINMLLSYLSLFFLLVFLAPYFQVRKWVVAFVLFLPLAMQSIYYEFYKVPLDVFAIGFFLKDPLLSLSFGKGLFSLKTVLFYIVVYALVFYVLLKINKNFQVGRKIRYFSLFIFAFGAFFCGTNWYLVNQYQNPILAAYSLVPGYIRQLQFQEYSKNKPAIHLSATKKNLPNIIWIVGESLAKNHMSLYGYHRKTTPYLDSLQKEHKLIALNNVRSIGSRTIISVPYMLVGLQNIDPKGRFYSAPNILDYAKAREYHTYLISSQDLRWRNFDQFVGKDSADVFREGSDFDANVSVSKGANDLDVLHRSILPELKKAKGPFLMILHMDGSHYPFSEHSTAKYKKYLPEKAPNGTNAYDNSIVYSNEYWKELITAAQKKDPHIWVFYATDHGQSVPLAKREDGSTQSGVVFNQGYTENIVDIPFFVVPPSTAYSKILKQQNALVAQSDIFATCLDLMHIQPVSHTDGYSLLRPIPQNRVRITSDYVLTNDNRSPTAHVFSPQPGDSALVDFERRSVEYENGTVIPFAKAPARTLSLFKGMY